MGGRRNGFCRVKDSIEPEALRARWVVCEVWADRWVEGEGKGGVKGLSSRAEVREKVRGEYRFSSLMN
jgi:hypothetical protein